MKSVINNRDGICDDGQRASGWVRGGQRKKGTGEIRERAGPAGGDAFFIQLITQQ